MNELIKEIETHMKKHFEHKAKSLTETIRKHVIRCASDGSWNTLVNVDEGVWENVADAFRAQELIVTKVERNRYKNLGLDVNMKISWEHLKHEINDMLVNSIVTLSRNKK